MSQAYIPGALRRLVRERSGDQCEYCLTPELITFAPLWIDPIIAEKHGGATTAENLANSCIQCNQAKGSDVASIDPVSGQLAALYNPRMDHWADHFRIEDGMFMPLTPVGRVTARLLKLNDPDRIEERKQLILAGLIVTPGS